MEIEKIIRTLEAMRSNAHAVARIYAEQGEKQLEDNCVYTAIGISKAIYMLKDEDYAKDMFNIYFGGKSDGT